MLDPMGHYFLARLRRDDLVREAAAARLAQEALRTRPQSPTPAPARSRQPGLAWLGFIAQRFRLAASDSPGARGFDVIV